ncbi:YegJ family protein [Mesorhizobium sp.]|uniref:YegJ family protein n=1 Tax=Mesorhizobium sp. TaxID=1871066 RepID=UPI003BAAB81D
MKLAIRAVLSVILVFAPGLAGAQATDPGDDKTMVFTPGDPEMAAATARALASLDEFLALSEAPPAGAERFKLKVKVRDGNITEHFWVVPFRRTETGFVGILSNQPAEVRNVVLGQNIEFTREDISDWGYKRNGRQVGSFTVCVMLKRMPKEEADSMLENYGFDC